MLRATLAAAAALIVAGCASIPEPAFTGAEIAFHSLNAIDQAQSINAISHDCYREIDPITSNLLGAKPAAGSYVVYGLALSLAFHALNRLDWVRERPALRATLDVLAIGAKGWQVAHNDRIGMRVSGANTGCTP